MTQKTQGAALILVLMVVSILGLLSLQIGLTAKDHIARAELLQARTEAQLRLQSSEVALVFSLLTQPWEANAPEEVKNPYAAAWNFHGQPFEVDGVRYAIQDAKALLPVPQGGESTAELERLLQRLGVEPSRSRQFSDALRSGQDPDFRARAPTDRPVPWQSLDELRSLGVLTADEFTRLRSRLSLFPSADFNPLDAPREVLATRYNDDIVETLSTLQSKGELDAETFARVTGLADDEFTVLYPGPALQLTTEREDPGFRLRRESTLVLRPYAYEPVQLWGRRQQ